MLFKKNPYIAFSLIVVSLVIAKVKSKEPIEGATY